MCNSVRRAWVAIGLVAAIGLSIAVALFVGSSSVDVAREQAATPQAPIDARTLVREAELLDVKGFTRERVSAVTSERHEPTTRETGVRPSLRGTLSLPDATSLAKLTLAIRRDVASDETKLDPDTATEFFRTADDNGEFVFSDLPPGRYRPTLPGHRTLAIEPAWIDVTGDVFVEWTVDAHMLAVEAVTAASAPVERAVVKAMVSSKARDDVTKTETSEMRSATDSRGIAMLLVDRPSTVDVLARCGELEGREVGVVLSNHPRVVHVKVLLLPPLQTGAVQIRVRNQLGDEVRVFRVRLRDRETGGSFRFLGPEDLDGASCITDLRPGEYHVELARFYSVLEPEFYIDSDHLKTSVLVSAGQVAPVEFRVTEGGRIRVRCDDVAASAESGIDVAVMARPYDGGADVRLSFMSGDAKTMSVSRNLIVNERRLAQQTLPAGRYVLTVQSDRHEPVTADCAVGVGRIEDVDFVLQRRAN